MSVPQIIVLVPGAVFVVGLAVFWLWTESVLRDRRKLAAKRTESRAQEESAPRLEEFSSDPGLDATVQRMIADCEARLEKERAAIREEYEQSRKVTEIIYQRQLEDKIKALDASALQALLDELSELGQKLRLFDAQLTLHDPLIPSSAVSRTAESVLLMAITQLDGFCSVRKLEEAFSEHNDRYNAAVQRQLRVTQKDIRETLSRFTMTDRPKAFTIRKANENGLYFLLYVNGSYRRIIGFEELFHAWQQAVSIS